MILSNECYIIDKCKKYNEGKCVLDSTYCPKLFKVDYLYNQSLLTNAQRKYIGLRPDMDGTDRDNFIYLKSVEQNIEKFVTDGNSLYIYSEHCGNGKTAWSIRLIQDYINAIWYKCTLDCKAMFISVPKFLLELKSNIDSKSQYIEHIKSNILTADIVVWDEVGTKAVTTFEHENLLSCINTRIDNNKCNIFTSNLTQEQLKEAVGERLYSRVITKSTVLHFQGSDKRGIK